MLRPEIPPSLAPDLHIRLKDRFQNFPLFQGWGLSIDSLEPGQAVLKAKDSEKIRNTVGMIHGGAQAAIADSACALALCTVFDGAMPFSTSDMHIRFLEPASGTLTAQAGVLRLSARSAILECRLSCGGQVVALCTAHFALKSRKGE
jgi:uncharacterized protein (TIGR00369 family)